MKIAILTLGTRGDVQPYAVLGKALKQRGHEITISTAKNFEQLIKSYGLDFAPVEADFQALLNSEEGNKIRKNPFLAKKYMKQFVYPMMADAFVTFYALAQKATGFYFTSKQWQTILPTSFLKKLSRQSDPCQSAKQCISKPGFCSLTTSTVPEQIQL